MRLSRPFHLTLVLAATAIMVSCVESTAPEVPELAPAAQASPELLEALSPTLQRVGLLRCDPMPAVFVRERIGPEGGTIEIGEHTLRIPAGALDRRVTISAYAPRARVNRVEFAPHGLEFARPAVLTMSYANCDLLGSLLPKHIAYINDDLSIIHLLETLDNFRRRQVSARLDHFSEYAVAW
mgnify:CR=1 FL=1